MGQQNLNMERKDKFVSETLLENKHLVTKKTNQVHITMFIANPVIEPASENTGANLVDL